jgi:hypothetical protein
MINDIYQVVLENKANRTLHHVAFFDSEDNATDCMRKLHSSVAHEGISVGVFKNEINENKWNGVVDYNELLCKFN